MSNKTQLQTNNTALDALITRVNAAKDVAASLPEAGGGGGNANIEICTVTISFTNSDPREVFISGTQLEDGNIVPFTFVDSDDSSSQSFSSPLTIVNIVKNTIITVVGHG